MQRKSMKLAYEKIPGRTLVFSASCVGSLLALGIFFDMYIVFLRLNFPLAVVVTQTKSEGKQIKL
jgi:hypothetical protein